MSIEFFKTSITGAMFIITILLIRRLLLYYLPKLALYILWLIATIRMLWPFPILSAWSIYNLAPSVSFTQASAPIQTTDMHNLNGTIQMPMQQAVQAAVSETKQFSLTPQMLLLGIWGAGCLFCITYFILSYCRGRKRLRNALMVKHPFVSNWFLEHPLRRKCMIYESATIDTPLTFGIIYPVLILPQNINWNDKGQMEYVLTHEYIHIRRFDALFKWMLAITTCLHWFNPLVWVMFYLANRDIELSCDEIVIKRLGNRTLYARTLLNMEEKRAAFSLNSYFSQNSMEERILAIMKNKGFTRFAITSAIVLVCGITVAFATNPLRPKESEIPGIQSANGMQTEQDALQLAPPSNLKLTRGQLYQWERYTQGKAPAVVNHMKQMKEEEIKSVQKLLELETMASSSNRNFTSNEVLRRIALQSEYYNGNLPKKSLPLTKQTDGYYYDIANDAYYYPKAELTDEQLLELIDFNEKVDYVVFLRELKEGTEYIYPMRPIAMPTTEELSKVQATIKDFYKTDVSNWPVTTYDNSETSFTIVIGDRQANDTSPYYYVNISTKPFAIEMMGKYSNRPLQLEENASEATLDAKKEVGPLEQPLSKDSYFIILNKTEQLLRGSMGVKDNITRTRIYAVADSAMVGVEYALADGTYCIVTLSYPDFAPRSYQKALTQSWIDSQLSHGDMEYTKVLYEQAS